MTWPFAILLILALLVGVACAVARCRSFSRFANRGCAASLGLVIGLMWTCCPTGSKAEIVLPSVFSDGAVLQRDTRAAIWGTASPGARINVRFRDSSAQASADAQGGWSLTLPPMQAANEPADLTVTSSDAQDAPRTIKNLLVGDVWLCSGQSNMYWPLGKVSVHPGVEEGEAAIAAPPDPQLRLFCDDKHPLWENCGWQAATPESRRPFSAVAYFYGAKLRRELGVPIGLINISRGGTPIQRWTPPAYAERVPLTKRFNALFNQERARINEYNRQLAAREKADREHRALPAAPATLPADLMIARSFSGATAYERFVAPVVPYTLRGVIWYQGESNSGELEVVQSYAAMFKALVDGWRDAWGAPDLPFYVVQLPCWDSGEFWPWTRQAMLVASQSVPHCDMVVSFDVGDTANLHPPQKRPIGERLAAVALARSYGRSIPWSGPAISGVSSEGSKVTLSFDPAKGMPRAKDNFWRDVELAGPDGVFHPASVTISGASATAESEKVAAPTSIRYGWRAVFTPTLFNEAGLPGSGFYYVRNANGRWSLYVP